MKRPSLPSAPRPDDEPAIGANSAPARASASTRPARPAKSSARNSVSNSASESVPSSSSRAVADDAAQQRARQLSETLAEQRRRSAWLNGFRFSAFSLILAVVLVVGVLSLIPRIQEFAAQRQQINALNADIAQIRADTAAKDAERQQWNDPTFIETQAREQLSYVNPGDVSYTVINDLPAQAAGGSTAAQARTTVQQTQSQWLVNLLGSVWSAGAATTGSSTPAPTAPSSPSAQ